MTTIEVFADITCPFTHVGLKRVVDHAPTADIIVRAWPLEWVNGQGLDVDGVLVKARVLHDELDIDEFSGLRADRWPTTTIPALELAAAAYAVDAATGLGVSIALRTALFEEGRDVSDTDVLADIADAHGITTGHMRAAVEADYAAGVARGVRGSPHFWVADDEYFCPALDIGHDADDHLTARFDEDGLARFFARIDR